LINVIIYGNGFIGNRLSNYLNCPVIENKKLTVQDVINDIKNTKSNVLINCIGKTGVENVDECENNIDQTLESNCLVPLVLYEACIRTKTKFIHFSTGCIYNYDYSIDKPFVEEVIPDFYELFYSRTKIYSEMSLKHAPNTLLIRPRIPIDYIPHSRNLLTKLLTFKNIINIKNSITYIPHMLDAIKHLIDIEATGIYNVVSQGGITYPEILDIYQQRKNVKIDYNIISFEQLKMVRTNLLLSTNKLYSSGFQIKNVYDAVEECIDKYKGD